MSTSRQTILATITYLTIQENQATNAERNLSVLTIEIYQMCVLTSVCRLCRGSQKRGLENDSELGQNNFDI